MALGVSPKEMEKNYFDWKNDVKDRAKVMYIDLLFPMLIPLGYDRKEKRYRYKCKHLIFRGKKAVCSIYKIRPAFPCKDYGQHEKYRMGTVGSLNRELYPNCVF
jgi:hypothetical protein